MFSTKKWNLSHLYTRRFVIVFSLLFVSLFLTGSRLVSADNKAGFVAVQANSIDITLNIAAGGAIELGLNSGINQIVSTNSIGPDDGNITIDPITISKTSGPEVTLTLIADNDIVGSGFVIENTSGSPLHIIFQAAGSIEISDFTLAINGGDVTMTGTGHGDAAISGLEMAAGISFVTGAIDTTTATPGFAGAITLTGTGNQDSRGGAADTGGNFGVYLADTVLIGGGLNAAGTATNNIEIVGVAGGLPNSDVVAAASLDNYGDDNVGVFFNSSNIILDHDRDNSADPSLTPELKIAGTGGPGASGNQGVRFEHIGDQQIETTHADLDILGTGGGLPAAAIRQAVTAHGALPNDTLLDAISSNLGDNNDGVELTATDGLDISVFESGNLTINGKAGNGLAGNSGIDISPGGSLSIYAESGNISLTGLGGGLDSEAIRGAGPSFILEDPNSVVDTLYERDLSDADIVLFGDLFPIEESGENYGVNLFGTTVDVASNYIEPAAIRDLNNYFLTGSFTDSTTFVPDRTSGRDTLNILGTRHPAARHILITGKGGMGADFNSGVSTFSDDATNIYSTSADIYLLGSGGGIPNAYVTGLIENAKDTTPFAGSDRTDFGGTIGHTVDASSGADGVEVTALNSTVITAMVLMYGESNNGLDLFSVTSLTILADRTTDYAFANRTQKETGGNVVLSGIGGSGQSDNAGVWIASEESTTIESGIGNIEISGIAGGLPAGSDQLIGEPSGDVFAIQHPGNQRVDRLLEVDMSAADIGQLIDELWEPASRNRGIDIDAQVDLTILSGFKEPSALRRFDTGTYGFGTIDPAGLALAVNVDDANNRGDLVLVPADGDGDYLLADAAGALLAVDNQTAFNSHDYTTTTANGVPVIQRRSIVIHGLGGSGDQRSEGVSLEASDTLSIETLAAEINIDGIGGGVPVLFTKSIIENIADIDPIAGTDRIDDFIGDGTVTDNVSTFIATQDMTAEDLLNAIGDLHSSRNRGVDILSSTDILVETVLTNDTVWPNIVVTETDILPDLGPSGLEEIDATIYGLGQIALDDLPAVDISGLTTAERAGLQAMIAKASDTLLVTANLNRADISIYGVGAVGADDNDGVKFEAVAGDTIIQVSNTLSTAFDGGNLEITGHAGGFPAGDEYSLNSDNLVYIDENGITDNLLEVDLNSDDLNLMFNAGFFDDYNEGIYIASELSTFILSDFIEPFVPAGPGSDDWGTPVHTRQSDGDLLVARRDIRMTGNGGVGSYDTEGVDVNSGDETTIQTASANISIEGNAGGMPGIVGRHMIINGTEGTAADLHSDGTPAVNGAIIAAVLALYGEQNTGVEIRGGNSMNIISSYPFVSAPNSEVGAVRIVGNGGNGSYNNYGVDIDDLSATIVSGMGNIAIVGKGGGYPSSLFIGSETGIDSFNELPGLTALDLLPLSFVCECSGPGGANAGVILLADTGLIISGFNEPSIGDPDNGEAHTYSYQTNGNRNPFFLGAGTVTDTTPKIGANGPVRVNRSDIPEIGSNAAGREVVIAGQGGFGSFDNEGIYVEAASSFVIVSADADVDIDGKAGGIPDAVVGALFATHDDGPAGEMNTMIALLYGTLNDGVSFNGFDTGIVIFDRGNLEINGQAGEGFGDNFGIYLVDGSFIEAQQGDILMVGEGGGVLETFGPTFDTIDLSSCPSGVICPVLRAAESITRSTSRTTQSRAPQALDDLNGFGPRSYNVGIGLIGDSVVASYFDAQVVDDPYQTKTEAVVLLNGTVGNNAGLGIDEAGEEIDINDPSYEPDLGGVLTDDPGIWIDFFSAILADDADIDLFAAGDLLIRGTSGITTTNGNLAAVATRHLEVSDGSNLNSQAADSLTTVAWDLLDPSADSLGRLKVDATSSIGAGDGAGELRLYGYRRGSNPQLFNANAVTAAPYGQPAAYNNEIDPAALFNGVAWTHVEAGSPADNSGDHAAEFETWNQEQWATPFDDTGRTVLADSDRFGGMPIPSTYDFGNPGVYTGDVTFYYGQMPTVTLTVDPLVGSEAGQTVITVTVSLSFPAGNNASVDLNSGGTATSGLDYTALTSPVTFAVGETETTLVFTIIDDTLFDPDETVTLALSNAIQLLLEDPMTTTVTIVDDDLSLLFLPLIFNQFVVASDLVVESITTTGGVLQVTIKNQGNGPVLDSFWVDLFVNPSSIPTQANDMLVQLGSMGLVWGIGGDQLPLAPGASLVLTVYDASFDRLHSNLTGGIPAGATLYGHVDAWNSLSNTGAIYETHEQVGGSYNNILGSIAASTISLPTYTPGVTRGSQMSPAR